MAAFDVAMPEFGLVLEPHRLTLPEAVVGVAVVGACVVGAAVSPSAVIGAVVVGAAVSLSH